MTRTLCHTSGDFMARVLNTLILLQGLHLVKIVSSSGVQATEVSYSSVLQNLPGSLKSYFHQIYSGPLGIRQPQHHLFSLNSYQLGFISIATTSLSAFFVLCAAIFMTNWARSFWNGGRPRLLSPFGSRSNPPKVTENDYSYVTNAEITQPGRTYDQSKKHPPAQSMETVGDTLLLKNGDNSYPVSFPFDSIYDGRLRIQDVKERLAVILGLPRGSERNIQLQSKGLLLNDDRKACRDFGLKNKSLMYFTIDDRQSHSDESTVESESVDDKKKRRRGRKGKKAANKRKDPNLTNQDASLSSRSETPPIQKIQGPMDKLTTLSNHFRTQLVPLCLDFIGSPPDDEKKKEFEYRKLSETMMNEVVLKLDAVETDGDNDAREMRRALVKEAQGVLNKLDAVMGK
ncbi:putative bag domain-containing protein [Erysiphe neolycopersici]|uniref:Putative bag domain-containing protein n=1 Tax=Erysiphe neolycopersici TaxID=212602 RepID=A0A420HVL8_9PEZI|nr:putative bag domain-containing protein [Erysiphe neolycopersici]